MLEILLKKLEKNQFFPLIDNHTILPKGDGIYLVCVKGIELLPPQMRSLDYRFINNCPVIYVGISKKQGIRKRDYRNHFYGNARGSTLRKSLGVLFGLRKLHSNSERGTTKYRFVPSDEMKLSGWMKENVFLHFIQYNNPDEFEVSLIDHFNPPLNIRNNTNQGNIEFRQKLSLLRNTIEG